MTSFSIKLFRDKLLDSTPECGAQCILTPEEELIVDIIYWARNRGKGKEEAMRLKCFPGPYVFKDPKGRYWPRPTEGCDVLDIDHMLDTGKVNPKTQKSIYYYDCWAYYKHCKTREHIIYLVKHRLSAPSLQSFLNECALPIARVLGHGIGLHVNDEHPLIQAFVRDALSGINFDINKYAG